jgi:hypothetical protein
MWNPFKTLNKSAPDIKSLISLPNQAKESLYNSNINKITIRYFMDFSFKDSQDITGEIVHNLGLPLIIFEKPFSGAILFVEECTYHNHSKDMELTIDLVKDYPFGIDHKSDVFKDNNIEFHNNTYEIRITDKSLFEYYNKKYKFYIPMMLNKTPLPIIRLDYADRILTPITEEKVKRLSNITQVFLRSFMRIKLLEKTGTKKDGIGWIAIFFIAIGFALHALIGLFVK